MAFEERQLVVVVVDLARFTRAVAGLDAVAIAGVLDRFYAVAGRVVTERGGRVVKYLGDGCLVVFPPERAAVAVDSVEALADEVRGLAGQVQLDLELGANLHLCTAAEGRYESTGAEDVVGVGVVHAFRIGGGPGVRISEPVYRKLPSDRRGRWAKYQPPSVYSLAVR
jgi:class 3 adenylate cyclase